MPCCAVRVLPLMALVATLLGVPLVRPALAADKVVGNGTAASCTRDALAAALGGGGSITFNCGALPATIIIAQPLDITAPETIINGNNTITLQGQNARLINHRTFGTIGSSVLTLKNVIISGGRASGGGSSDGAYEANGGALRSFFQAANPAFKPTLNIENVQFRDNRSTLTSVPSGLDAYDFGGGAIYSQGGFVNVTNSRFENNDAANGSGGAIHILQSGLTIENSSFAGNSALGTRPQDSLGGAIYIDGLGGENGLFRVLRGVFSDNESYNSGGAIHVNMYENSSRTEIVESHFSNNAVIGGTRAQGGAIGGGGSSLGGATGNPQISISASLFEGNSVKRTAGADGNSHEDGSGGALAFPQTARLSIVNSTFYGNKAFGDSYNANGGALYVVNNSDPFEIANSTFANNTAGWVGGAISNSQIGGQPGGQLRNTIFANNTASGIANFQQHCSTELLHDGASLQFPPRQTDGNYFNDVTCFQGKSAPSQKSDPLFRDPKLVALANNGGPTKTMAIPADSPALNAGKNCPAADQRGVARPQGSACDIGAFELVLALSVDRDLVAVGDSARTLLVSGFGFTSASVVQVNGAERPTTFVSSTQLRVELQAADLAAVGTLTVSVRGSELSPVAVRVVAQLNRIYLPLTRR